MHRVLITGAAGAIGGTLRQGLRGRYPVLRLSDVAPLGTAGPGEELDGADLFDLSQVEAACRYVDAVVHLGGQPVEADWETVHRNNIVGTYNLFEAARRQGVRRVVFASSNHTIGYYRRADRVGPDEPVRPDSRYGVSKVFGEALGRMYADKHGLEVVCLRIGSFRPEPQDVRMLSTWISPRDTVQLTRCALEAPEIHFLVVYGVSANARGWWDDTVAASLGYRPQDDAESYAESVLSRQAPADEPELERTFHGGAFCAMEFSGDPNRIT